MSLLADLVLVFLAGLVTALATGLGAIPFFIVDDVSDRWNVWLWGLAGGIMVSASVFGLVGEGLAYSSDLPWRLALGLLAGVVLVVAANRVLTRTGYGHSHGPGDEDHAHEPNGGGHDHDNTHDHDGAHDHAQDELARNGGDAAGPAADHGDLEGEERIAIEEAQALAERNWRKLLLILGILTVHSFPEGVAIGVSFAELGFEGGVPFLGFAVPVLAIFMTVAISIHNVPEGLAISIPLQALGMSRWRMVGAAVFSSLPQPIGAVVAFVFVRWAREFMPFGFGFAAGAMIYLVATEFVPEALESGEDLPRRGYPQLVAGLLVGGAVMVPLAFI